MQDSQALLQVVEAAQADVLCLGDHKLQASALNYCHHTELQIILHKMLIIHLGSARLRRLHRHYPAAGIALCHWAPSPSYLLNFWCFNGPQPQHVEDTEKLCGLPGWHCYWSCSAGKLGYAGAAILSKEKPISVQYGIGVAEHDVEGRVVR